MLSQRLSAFLQHAEAEEPLMLRRPRLLGGALYGAIAGLAFGLTVGTINTLTFPDLPITIDWKASILIGVILGFVLAIIGLLTGWYTERLLGVAAGAVAISLVGLGVQLVVVGVGAVGVIMLIVLAFPISVISLPIAIFLRWLSDHHSRILYHSNSFWKRSGWTALLVTAALILGILPASLQRMNIREERSARLVDTALRNANTDPQQAKLLPLDTLPGLREHLNTPYTLRVTPSKISSVGYDIHVIFEDGFAITCVTVAYTSTPYMRSCSPGAEIILEK